MALTLTISFLTGCTKSERTGVNRADARVFVDVLGDTLALTANPQRIVSLAPSLTELVFAVGASDRLVGVTDFCDYPAAARTKPRVAGFNVLNLESLVAARPDLVLANRGNSPADLEAIREFGIPVFAFQIDSIPALVKAVRTLGEILDAQAQAESTATSWENRIAAVVARAQSVPSANRPRVFFGGLSEPIYSVAHGSFINDVIVRAGGRNVFADMPTAWPRVDLETLVQRNPDVVLVGYHNESTEDAARLRTAPGWGRIKAVQEGRVVVLGDAIMREGPRLIDGLEQVSRALYPHEVAGQ
jgi:iron complex transport system substrate-binding protein